MQKIVTSLNVTIRLNQIGINDSELLNNFETNNDNKERTLLFCA